MSNYIAQYITLAEYTCPCGHCHGLPPMLNEIVDTNDIPVIYSEFFDDFSVIRAEWGKPIRISSGYRCPKYNASIGGSLLSAHMAGIALDLDVNIGEVERLDAIIEDVAPHLRRGKYTNAGSFIHIDVAFHVYPRMSETWVQGYRFYG